MAFDAHFCVLLFTGCLSMLIFTRVSGAAVA